MSAKFRGASSLAICVCLLLPANAFAQQTSAENQPAEVQSGTRSNAIEEIVVTARRRVETLQTAPVAVTALSGNALQDRSLTTTEDLVQIVPTMVSPRAGNGGGTGQFFLRGIGQNDPTINVDPGVALYIDGVYFARTQGANLELADVERVEVLRGPQGTLYGKNAAGGLINYITRRPDAPEQTKAQLEVAERNRLRGQFSFNRAISDSFYLGASVVALRNDGYGTPVLMPEEYNTFGIGKGDFGKRAMVSGRVALMFKPSDNVSLLLRGDMTEEDGTAQPNVLYAVGPGTLADRLLTDEQRADLGNFDKIYSGYRAATEQSLRGVSLEAEFDLGAVTIKSLTAYRTIDQSNGFDLDAMPGASADQSQILDQTQFSEELQLSGSMGAIDWITGLYFLDERPNLERVLDGRVSSGSAGRGQIRYQDAELVNKSYGAFVNLDYALNSRLSVNAALRYTYETKDIHRVTRFYPDANLDVPNSSPEDRQDGDSWDQFTPKLALNFQATPDLLTYASYSRGFRSGGFNIRPAPDSEDAFNPEVVDAIELGFKSDFFGRTLRVNGALFYNWYKSIQLLARDGSSIYTFNGGEATTKGAELEVTASPVDSLNLNLGVGYLETGLTKLDPRAEAAGLRVGYELSYAPKWTVSAGAEYAIPVSDTADLRVRGDVSYRSSIWHSGFNTPLSYQDGFALVNGKVTYDSGEMQLSVYATNLFDKRYFLLQGDNTGSGATGFAYGVPNEPRRIGVQLGYEF